VRNYLLTIAQISLTDLSYRDFTKWFIRNQSSNKPLYEGQTTSFKNKTKFVSFGSHEVVWLRRLNGNWQRAARIPRILQWLLAGLMLIIGLAIGILGAKLASSAAHCTSR
jgi:hypothetical protein